MTKEEEIVLKEIFSKTKSEIEQLPTNSKINVYITKKQLLYIIDLLENAGRK